MSSEGVSTPSYRFDVLKKLGFLPQVIYDVGSHIGEWTKEHKIIFPDAQFYLFEANEDHRRYVDGPNVYYGLLGDTDGTNITYYKSTSENIWWTTGNGIYKENNAGGVEFNPIQLSTKTLDSIIHERNLPPPTLLKLDTQGSELDILHGASKALTTVEIILMEISLHRWNEGGPLIHDVIVELDRLGFCLIDIQDRHYVNEIQIQVDGIFCKKNSPYLIKEFK